ncbi:MAG: hypothetical protein ACFFEN_02705 [Candidatus Thorarchaeota archaeon]
MAEGKFPKKPNYGNILEACRKDFRNFKKDNENQVLGLMNERIKQFTEINIDPKLISDQKENLESVKKLIREGRDDIAFSLFFRTFPSCLPHRSKRI